MATKKIYLYPVWIRIWHIINALMFLLLIFTGICLHFSSTKNSLIRFDVSVGIHNVAAIIVTFNYGVFLIGNIVTRNGKFYRKWRKNLTTNLWKQFKFYAVGIFNKEPHPFPITEKQKFNPLQKFSYVIVMYFGMPLLILSGIALLFPEMIAYNVFNISGLVFYSVLHIIVGFVLSLFLLIHIYTCTLGDKAGTLFKSMINGYHEEHE
ncbi:MAG: cytochrome b/b6 domain-containing protein [Bacteroidales bacterium]|nr:cytochrome b/b6 domain-containing protein [Bacteroidales bacterium]